MPNRDINPNNELAPEVTAPEDAATQTLPPETPSPAQCQEDVAQYVEVAADDPQTVFEAVSDDELDSNPSELKDEPGRVPQTAEQHEVIEARESSLPEKTLPDPGASFLHERNPKLHASREVEDVVAYLRTNDENIPNDPDAKVTAYLGFLASPEYVNDGTLTGEPDSLERQVEGQVIASKDIPESYFDLQRRIAREHGLGDQEITPELRLELTAAIQADQKASLNTWAGYLHSEDASYPDWFKRYTWENVTKLGRYDQEKEAFQKRSRGTVAPYPELDREALAYVHDALHKTRVQGEPIDDGERDPELQKHLTSGNFANLYAYAISEVSSDMAELHKETQGSWTIFQQSTDPEAGGKLANSLQGYGTGWCTAGEATARHQLREGDFYMYRTQDRNGEDTVPRVAIRMQGGEVAEVRGIKANQELELALADITVEKLQDLSGGEKYIQKAEDMKRLTAIEQATIDNLTPLAAHDLRFLYEIDQDIKGFGYESDPRIQEIRELRRGVDKPELVRMLSQDTLNQSGLAYKGYEAIASRLDMEEYVVADKRQIAETLAAQNDTWRANGVYDYLAEQTIKNGGHFTLVATPNVAASGRDILRVINDLGRNHPYGEPGYSRPIYEDMAYTAPELSGKWSNSPSGPVRFSLVSNKTDAEMDINPVEAHQRVLKERQTAHPGLNIHVPSVLEALSYWQSLRAKHDRLDDFPRPGDPYTLDVESETYVRHFDLPTQLFDLQEGWIVPLSVMYRDGRIGLGHTRASFSQPARLAVG